MTRIHLLLMTLFVLSPFKLLADDYIKEVITFLASDKLEGRKAGQIGNELALNYIENQMKKFQVSPLGTSYRQEFTIFTQMEKVGANYLKLNNHSYEFEPIAYSLSGELNSKLVFAGFGISIPKNDRDLKYDDYEGINVTNKVVIVFTGDPGIGNKNSLFRKPEYLNYSNIFYKLKNAIKHGASGILIVNNPLSLTHYPQERPLFFNASEGGGNRFSIISGNTTNNFLNKILPKNNSLELQKRIAKTQKPNSFDLNHAVNIAVGLKKKTGRVANIVGVVKGSDPVLSKEVIVLGAHMDHLGFGGESSMDNQVGEVHNGADDNASGTALVMKVARSLQKKKLKRSYLIALFNAEEMGLLGASHFINSWVRHESTYGKIKGMLNFDMVGRYQKDLSIMGVSSSLSWQKMLLKTNSKKLSINQKKVALGSSDHAVFLNKKIPALFFTTGAHEDYHRSTDDSDKINYESLSQQYKYVLEILKQIDNTTRLDFNPKYVTDDQSTGGSRGYGAHLGCIPKFGQSDDIVGVQCSGASQNSPAQNAGIVIGDILVEIGDIEIKNIYDLSFALKYYRAGDKIKLTWKREKRLMSQMVTLAQSAPRRH